MASFQRGGTLEGASISQQAGSEKQSQLCHLLALLGEHLLAFALYLLAPKVHRVVDTRAEAVGVDFQGFVGLFVWFWFFSVQCFLIF